VKVCYIDETGMVRKDNPDVKMRDVLGHSAPAMIANIYGLLSKKDAGSLLRDDQ
jgi:hypothetical protein